MTHTHQSAMEPEECGRRQRRIEGRSGYLTRKNDPHNISMDELQNPWTLASLFMRPTKECLAWLMDQELLDRESFLLEFLRFLQTKMPHNKYSEIFKAITKCFSGNYTGLFK